MDLLKSFFRFIPEMETPAAGYQIEIIILEIGFPHITLPQIHIDSLKVLPGLVDHGRRNIKAIQLHTRINIVDNT